VIADDLGISESTAGANLLSSARHCADGILHPLMGACVTRPLPRIGAAGRRRRSPVNDLSAEMGRRCWAETAR
jgi:hypothetical protein